MWGCCNSSLTLRLQAATLLDPLAHSDAGAWGRGAGIPKCCDNSSQGSLLHDVACDVRLLLSFFRFSCQVHQATKQILSMLFCPYLVLLHIHNSPNVTYLRTARCMCQACVAVAVAKWFWVDCITSFDCWHARAERLSLQRCCHIPHGNADGCVVWRFGRVAVWS